jgi:hypothetical protein
MTKDNDQGPNSSTTLLSIIPFLDGGKGHMYHYHLAVGRAAESLGWRHIAATNSDPTLKNLPEGWCPCLPEGLFVNGALYLLKAGKVSRLIQNILAFARAIAKFIRQATANPNQPIIIFIEGMHFTHLLLLTMILALVRKPHLSIWVLHRYRPRSWPLKYFISTVLTYKVTHLILNACYARRYKILTDSELLRISLQRLLKKDVQVMPIPHTGWDLAPSPARQSHESEVLCWWAGPPRPPKGWASIRRISQLKNEGSLPLTLVAARSSGLTERLDGIKVELIDDILPPAAYYHWMNTADILLLPYSAEIYAEETSGIFVEAVVAGKIPLVAGQTWLAHELRQYDLAELVLDWNRPDLLATLYQLARSDEIRRKLNLMRQHYRAYHQDSTYATTMKMLYELN